MTNQAILYCEECVKRVLHNWKGWPHKNAIPILPRIVGIVCEECGGNSAVVNSRITWFNYHSKYSTGLPDYWLLKIDGERTKWGHPYYGEGRCPKCDAVAIISQMKFPNGEQELKVNCANCGISNLPLPG